MKILSYILLTLIFVNFHRLESQSEHEIKIEIYGTVLDAETQEAIDNAVIRMPDLGITIATDTNGVFHISNLGKGEYNIEISAIGYKRIIKQCHLNGDSILNTTFALIPNSVVTPTIIVMDSKSNSKFTDLKDHSTELKGNELQKDMGFSLASTLKNETGIAIRSMGPAPARPVIRGLSGNRVVMSVDGVESVDLSAMSADHAVTIDPFTAEKIEIIRGPKTLLYSNSPAGGIVNVKSNYIPQNSLSKLFASASGFYESANNGYMGSIEIEKPIGLLDFKGLYSKKKGNDVSAPGRVILNTAMNTDFYNLGAGYNIHDFSAGASYNQFSSNYGIPGGVTGSHPKGVNIEMLKNNYNAKILVHFHKKFFDNIDINFSRSYYHHTEYESNQSVGAEYVIRDYMANIFINQIPDNSFNGTYGLYVNNKDFKVGGFVFMPPTNGTSIAPFIYEEFQFESWIIQISGRYNLDHYIPEKISTTVVSPDIRNKTFTSFSASLAVFKEMTDNWFVGSNISRISRAPQIEELFNMGPHLAAYSYDIGNPNLANEKGIGTELVTYYRDDKIYAMMNVFLNEMSYFITPRNTGDTNYSVLLPIYQTNGVPARFFGFEGMIEFKFLSKMQISTSISYTNAVFSLSGNSLPMIPPLKANIELKYQDRGLAFGARTDFSASQNKVDVYEEPTKAYIIFGLYGQYLFNYMSLVNTITLNIDNLFNREYRNHLSRIKSIMPEPGINIRLIYKVYFE